MHKFNYNRNLLPTFFLLYFTENFQIHGHNTRQTNLLHVDRKKQQQARDLLNLKVENYGMTYRHQFEYIGGNKLFKENSNFIC